MSSSRNPTSSREGNMNFVFISPQFPETYWLWCDRLRSCGASVYGIGDTPVEAISSELHRALDEYVQVDSLENYDQVFPSRTSPGSTGTWTGSSR